MIALYVCDGMMFCFKRERERLVELLLAALFHSKNFEPCYEDHVQLIVCAMQVTILMIFVCFPF